MVASTPVRRSTRGMPLVAPSTAQYSHAKNSTYSWLEPLPPTAVPDLNSDEDAPEKRYYKSFIRVSQKSGKGIKRTTKHSDEPAIEQLRFNIGDGVLVACHGNSIGVGVLTKLWDELRVVEHDESDDEDEEDPEHEWRKQCEIRWCYRRQDLPTTMNQMALLDVSNTSTH
jgi:origin recognition complex subunit 1